MRVEGMVQAALTHAADTSASLSTDDVSCVLLYALRDSFQETARSLQCVAHRTASRVPFHAAAGALQAQLSLPVAPGLGGWPAHCNRAATETELQQSMQRQQSCWAAGQQSLEPEPAQLLLAVVGTDARKVWEARAAAAWMLSLASTAQSIQEATASSRESAADERVGGGSGGGGARGRCWLGPEETLLFARGEVMRGVCVRAQGEWEEAAGRGGGVMVAVGSSKLIRETVCRPHPHLLGMPATAATAAMPVAGGAPASEGRGLVGGFPGGGYAERGRLGAAAASAAGTAAASAAGAAAASVGTAVEGLMEGIWDSLSSAAAGADEVLQHARLTADHVGVTKPSSTLSAYSPFAAYRDLSKGGGGGGHAGGVGGGSEGRECEGAASSAGVTNGRGMLTGITNLSTGIANLSSSQGAHALAAHPCLPLFVSGGSDGSLSVWSFGAPQPVASLAPLSSSPVTRIVFDPSGNHVAVADGSGACGVYHLVALVSSTGMRRRRPVHLLDAHANKALALAFISRGASLLATGGLSGSKDLGVSVRVWDLLRSTSRSCVASVAVHDGGCGALLAHPSRPLLISGGIKGDICLTSTLSWRPLCTIPAHKGAVKCMTSVPPACTPGHWGYFVSGASDGDIKLWDLEALEAAAADDSDASTVAGSACVQHLSDCHDKSPQPLGVSYGVTAMCSTRSSLLTCGGDGRLVRRPWLVA